MTNNVNLIVNRNLAHEKVVVQRDNEDTGDIVLIAGEDLQRFPCHRNILCRRSKYFSAMFRSSMLETLAREVKLHEVSGKTLRILVNHCYTGFLQIQEENVADLLRTATFLQFSLAVEKCAMFFKNEMMDATNCFGIGQLAEQQSCTTLINAVEEYIDDNYMEVYREEEFRELKLEQLIKIISRNNLAVDSEMTVFHSVKKWLQHDSGNRWKHTLELLKLVWLPLLPEWFLDKHVEDTPLYKEALLWHRATGNQLRHRRQRKNTELLAVYSSHDDAYIRLHKYCPLLDTWSYSGRINNPTFRQHFAVAVLNDQCFIVSGEEDNIEVVDLVTEMRSQLVSLKRARFEFSVAVLGGALYIVGGYKWNNHYLNSVEKFDPDSGDWGYVARMSVRRSIVGLAVLEGRLYAVGGKNSDCCLKSTECYDPVSDKWITLADMNQGRCYHGITAGNGYVYVLGGNHREEENGIFERYDPRCDTWTQICSTNWMSWGSIYECAFIGDTLMAMQMHVGETVTEIEVHRYNLETNKWAQGKQIPFPYDRPPVVVALQKFL